MWSTYLYVYYWCLTKHLRAFTTGSRLKAMCIIQAWIKHFCSTVFIILPTYKVESYVLICSLMNWCQAANFIVNELHRILNCNIQLSRKPIIFVYTYIGI